MENNYPEIRELLQQKADYQARLNLLPYDGSPEIKEQGGKQYLYRKIRLMKWMRILISTITVRNVVHKS